MQSEPCNSDTTSSAPIDQGPDLIELDVQMQAESRTLPNSETAPRTIIPTPLLTDSPARSSTRLKPLSS